MRLLTGLALALLAYTPVVAGETPWQELAPNVRARLISEDVLRPDGTTLAGIEVEMPDSHNSYWRVPGEAGIPTELDLTGSTGISAHSIVWPYPRVETERGYLDYVYRGHTVLPVILTLQDDSALLVAQLTMGVCFEVCVPARAHFNLPLAMGKRDAGQGIRIAQALALTPLPWAEPPAAVGDVWFDAAANALVVPVTDHRLQAHSLIADAGTMGPQFGAPQKSRDGKLVSFSVLGGGDAAELLGLRVRLTFLTDDGPFEVWREIGSDAPEAAGEGK